MKSIQPPSPPASGTGAAGYCTASAVMVRPVARKFGTELLVGLVDHIPHATVGGHIGAVTLARTGRADPVEVRALRCGRGGLLPASPTRAVAATATAIPNRMNMLVTSPPTRPPLRPVSSVTQSPRSAASRSPQAGAAGCGRTPGIPPDRRHPQWPRRAGARRSHSPVDPPLRAMRFTPAPQACRTAARRTSPTADAAHWSVAAASTTSACSPMTFKRRSPSISGACSSRYRYFVSSANSSRRASSGARCAR